MRRTRLLVMRQVPPGRELILGARVDAAVGLVVLVGLNPLLAQPGAGGAIVVDARPRLGAAGSA